MLPVRHSAAPLRWVLCWLFISQMLAGLVCRAGAATVRIGQGSTLAQMQAAANGLQPGDTLEIAGGATYPGGLTFSAQGAPGRLITIRGLRVNGLRPKITGAGPNGHAALKVQGSHYLLEGLDVTTGEGTRATRGFYAVGDDITLRDSVVHDCPCTGISSADAAGSLTLDHVEVFHCGAGTLAHQIYVGSSLQSYPGACFRMQFCYVHDGAGGNNVKSRVSRNEIFYNRIQGAYYHELDLIGPDPKAQPALSGTLRCDSDIVGNVLIKEPGTHGTLARFGSDGTGDSHGRYRVVGNTIIVRAGAAAVFGLFWLRGEIQSGAFHDNVVDCPQGSFRLFRNETEGDVPLTGSGNWMSQGAAGVPAAWQTVFGADPGFRAAGKDDFRPVEASPLVTQRSAGRGDTAAQDNPGALPNTTFEPPDLVGFSTHAIDLPQKRTGGGAIGAYSASDR